MERRDTDKYKRHSVEESNAVHGGHWGNPSSGKGHGASPAPGGATHGFFADPEFRSALQVDPKLFEYRGFGERLGGARSPLVLSGLVLAGANRQGDEAAPDHGIITAEGLIGLRMEGLELAVYPPARRVSASRAAARASTASSAPSTSPAARTSSRPFGRWTTPPPRH